MSNQLQKKHFRTSPHGLSPCPAASLDNQVWDQLSADTFTQNNYLIK